MFKLKFSPKDIPYWASRYDYPESDEAPARIGRAARKAGLLSQEQFLLLTRWKTPRSQPRCARNSADFVRELTSAALRSRDARFKVEVLTLLDGVDWPTASVILHFCDKERWPIIDYRAFWSLGQPSPAGRYNFALWKEYTSFTRQLADRGKVDMRTVDRALWAYSRFRQRSTRG